MKTGILKRAAIAAIATTALFAVPTLVLTGCNTDSTTTFNPDAPREFFGILKYNGPSYAIFGKALPYKYAFYDINGAFIAYVDTSKIVMDDIGTLSQKTVFLRGVLGKIDGESVIVAEKLRTSRL